MKVKKIKSDRGDAYDDLPQELKDRITEDLEQADRGQIITNKEFKEKF
ncbi:MAG: hypothetical protein M3R17_12545 [Bacteroidota bacterium]|nr:hypothetical protein [Bacteroidota bacterium]